MRLKLVSIIPANAFIILLGVYVYNQYIILFCSFKDVPKWAPLFIAFSLISIILLSVSI